MLKYEIRKIYYKNNKIYITLLNTNLNHNADFEIEESINRYSPFDIVIYLINTINKFKKLPFDIEITKKLLNICELKIIEIIIKTDLKSEIYDSYINFIKIYKKIENIYKFKNYDNFLIYFDIKEEYEQKFQIFN